MTKPPSKPPTQKKSQHNYVQSAVRMPPELRDEIREAAELNGRPMNAEILARLQQSQITVLLRENAELKAMVREVLDILRDKF
jgi:hypothetical protein